NRGSNCAERGVRRGGTTFRPPDPECRPGSLPQPPSPFPVHGTGAMRTTSTATGCAPECGRHAQRPAVAPLTWRRQRVACSKTFQQAIACFTCTLERIKPVFVQKWPDLGFNHLPEPFACVADLNALRRRDVTVPDPELGPKPGIGRDGVIQHGKAIFDVRHGGRIDAAASL